MIKWLEVTNPINTDNYKWPSPWHNAEKFHHITAEAYVSLSRPIDKVVDALNFVTSTTKNLIAADKVALLSDNIQFEYRFMQRLFSNHSLGIEWPFHYCGWDSSLFLEATGVGDPPADTVVHRALPDALQLRDALLEAMEKIKGID